MKLLLIKVFLVFLCFICACYCYQVSFIEYCTEETHHNPEPFPSHGPKSYGSIIMSEAPVNGSYYRQNMNCSLTFSTEENFFLFLAFSNVSLRNSSMDNLTVIYNSDQAVLSLSGQQVCMNENCQGLMFDSGSYNNLTLVFQSSNVTVPSNVTGFIAHFTVYSLVGNNGACKERKMFLCENGHCISNELVCDNHNNCGDSSDETRCSVPVYDTIWGIVVIVVAILAIFVFVPLFCCLATYGTQNIVKTVTLSSAPTPMRGPYDCGEASTLLSSSEFHSTSWPGTSCETLGSYGTAQGIPADNSTLGQKLRSLSEACQSTNPKVL